MRALKLVTSLGEDHLLQSLTIGTWTVMFYDLLCNDGATVVRIVGSNGDDYYLASDHEEDYIPNIYMGLGSAALAAMTHLASMDALARARA